MSDTLLIRKLSLRLGMTTLALPAGFKVLCLYATRSGDGLLGFEAVLSFSDQAARSHPKEWSFFLGSAAECDEVPVGMEFLASCEHPWLSEPHSARRVFLLFGGE